MRNLPPRLLDLRVWDGIGHMSQMEQHLHVWRRILLQETRQPLPPRRNGSPPRRSWIFIDTRQQLLKEVLAEDQMVPAADLWGGQNLQLITCMELKTRRNCFNSDRKFHQDT